MELFLTATADADNPVEGDIHLEGGDLVWTSGLALEVAQRLRVRLRFFKGEWFLDLQEGTPWFQEILVKGVSDQAIRAVFSTIIRTCPGVASLDSLEFTQSGTARELVLDFRAKLEDGSTFQAKDHPPFIVRF